MSEVPDQVVPASEEAPSSDEAARGSSVSSYAEIGERVAGVLSAAEAAADRIRADARQEAEALLGQARQEAEQIRADATAGGAAQARATREAAEELARDIEEAAWQRGQALREQSRAVEEWLQKAVQTLHRMTAQLEDLPGAPPSPTEGESLADALKPTAREAAATELST